MRPTHGEEEVGTRIRQVTLAVAAGIGGSSIRWLSRGDGTTSFMWSSAPAGIGMIVTAVLVMAAFAAPLLVPRVLAWRRRRRDMRSAAVHKRAIRVARAAWRGARAREVVEDIACTRRVLDSALEGEIRFCRG